MNSTRHSSQIYCINYIGLTWRFLGLTFTLPLDCKFKFSWLLCIADSFFFLLSKNNITNVLAQSSWVTTKHGLLFFFHLQCCLYSLFVHTISLLTPVIRSNTWVIILTFQWNSMKKVFVVFYIVTRFHILIELDEASFHCI